MPVAVASSCSSSIGSIRTKRNSQRQRHKRYQRRSCSAYLILDIIAIVATFASRIGAVCALRNRASAFVVAATTTTSPSIISKQHSSRDFALSGIHRITTTTRRSLNSTAMDASKTGYDIPTSMRGLFAGSGVEGLSNPLINAQILDLLPAHKTKNGFQKINVLYLGTATYDIAYFREKQTGRFVDKGCTINHLDVASDDENLNLDHCAELIRSADVLLVGGGNTLFAVDRWNHLGLVEHMRKALERGCILTGGSAGAICWFDSGHSDSADPETYKEAMLQEYWSGSNSSSKKDKNSNAKKDESSDYDPSNKKEWKYLRCPGLGFVPGPMVCCPHHDKVQSNGLLRAHDFDEMLLQRARSSKRSVLGIGIDHYSAFIVEGEDYKVYSLPEKPGSISTTTESDKGFFDVSENGTPNGKPGVWIKRVIVADTANTNNDEDLCVEAMVCPPSGKLIDLLSYGGDNLPGQNNEEHDENQAAVDKCRKENPSGREF